MQSSSPCAATPAEMEIDPSVSCPPSTLAGEPSSPLDQAAREIAAVVAERGAVAPNVALANAASGAAALASAGVVISSGPESYAIFASGGATWIVASDAIGAMYGAYDFAERVRLAEPMPPPSPIVATPSFAVRGYNTHIVMPENGETCWYFLDASYWRGYLDNLARARIDFLDLHGVQSLQSSRFVDLLRYFATSETFPNVGVPASRRAQNLAMLQTIVTMANARGIRVGILSGRSDLAQCGDQIATAELCPLQSTDDLATYTREAVAELVRDVPGLWRIGVRIGESLEPASFYASTYLRALDGATPRFYTRSWLATEQDLASLGDVAGGEDMLVEVKLSDEQSGIPYAPQSGAAFGARKGPTDWQASYLYESLLDGPEPFSVIVQIWNSATYKYFRWASFERTHRAIVALLALSPRVKGFSLQPAHALESQRDTYHADPADRFSTWTYARDLLEPQLYGRLGYDPSTPEATLALELAAIAQSSAPELWDCEQAQTDIVAWIAQTHACGPDSRDFLPQLESVGPVAFWAAPPITPTSGAPITCVNGYQGPLDPFSFATPYETAQDLVGGAVTTRMSPLAVAARVESDVTRARSAASLTTSSNAYARDIGRECTAVADLGDYFAHKLRAATSLAVYAASSRSDYLAAARAETILADDAWSALSSDTTYFAPFVDAYRTEVAGLGGIPIWSAQSSLVASDPASIDAVVAAVQASPKSPAMNPPAASAWLAADAQGPGLGAITITPPDPQSSQWMVSVDLASPLANGLVTVLAKAMSTTSPWQTFPASGSGTHFVASIPSSGAGLQVAADVVDLDARAGWRYPDVTTSTPYVTLAP